MTFKRKTPRESGIVPDFDVSVYRGNPFQTFWSNIGRFVHNNQRKIRNTIIGITGLALLAAGIAAYNRKEVNQASTPLPQRQYPSEVQAQTMLSSVEDYGVEQGDSLWRIALKYGRQTDREIVGFIRQVQEINNMPEERDVVVYDFVSRQLKPGQDGLADRIYPGERFKMPSEDNIAYNTTTQNEHPSSAKGKQSKTTNLSYAIGALGAGVGLAGLAMAKKGNGNGKPDLEKLVEARNQRPYAGLDKLAKEANILGYKTEEDVRDGFARYFRDYHEHYERGVQGSIVARYDARIETEDMRKDRQALYAQEEQGLSETMKKYVADTYYKGASELTVHEILAAYTSVYGMNLSKTTFYNRNKRELGVSSRKEARDSSPKASKPL